MSILVFMELRVEGPHPMSWEALAAGQQMLLLYDPRDMALFAMASALVSIAALPVVLSVAPSPKPTETKFRLDIRRLFQISPRSN